ncbi:hypothetical protein C0J52_15614 [Blattella germanica]|nr:hypothetical protein C0J52_15614 [Blattella germanica]
MRPSSKHLLVAICATWALFQISLAGFACLSNPCVYGICIDDLNSTYTCYCIDGYTGVQCQTNWDECWSSPCLNGGTCIDGVAAFNCSCPDGFTGETCEENLDECDSNPCFNNATCLDDVNGYTCICPPGYSGMFCETDVAVCNSTGESRCLNGGICVEGPGDTFTCSCLEGWTGEICEDAIDECASSPCLNGGMCVDRHADYACACPFGYTGKNCEMKLHQCTTSPCENDALCLMEDGVRVCYCVPDYHGDRCQYQYDECQLGPRCMNGGTCLDGVDNFTCSCPPNLTGQFCECLIIGPGELNCSYIMPSTTTLLPSISSETSSSVTAEVPSTFTTVSVTEPINVTKETVVTSEFTTYHVPSFSSSTWVSEVITSEISTRSITSTSDTSISSKYTVPFEETTPTLFPETTSFSPFTESEVPSTESSTSTFTADNETSSKEFSTSSTITIPTEKEITLTPSTNITEEVVTPVISTTSSAVYTNQTYISTSSQITVEYTTPAITPEVPLNITSEKASPRFDESTTTVSTTEVTVSSESTPPYHPVTPVTSTTENITSTEVVTSRSESPPGPTDMITSTSQGPEVTTESTSYSSSTEFSSESYSTSTEIPDCSISPCFNGGTCVHSKEGPRCVCKFGWEGALCEEQLGIKTAAFTGQSYLSHRLFNSTGTHIDVVARTMAPTGILLYAHLTPDMYMYLYLEDGLLKFQFSCGIQTMLFSEVQIRVNNGFDLAVQVTSTIRLEMSSGMQWTDTTLLNALVWLAYRILVLELRLVWNTKTHGTVSVHQDLEIGQPSFSSSVGGLASYAAYPIPGAIHNSMELKFKFMPTTMEQIALLVFVGQDGYHDSRADHLSVSFIKGYVVLTWNLGSGPRRIFTPRPVAQKPNRPHTVRLGRVGQLAWLLVDNLGNVSGKSPGRLSQLNTRSLLYLGGHESGNFSLLPHDLPLHSGFSGCLFDVELKAGRVSIALQRQQAATGRSVGQCGTSECHEHACQHGGACLHHGATYTCLCPEGRFGPTCALRFNPCDSTRHNCSSGSTCVPLVNGYECDCPLGKAGRFCERDEMLSDVAFSGIRSYLALPPVEMNLQQSTIDMEVRPLHDRGLLLYVGHKDGNNFLSLSLQGGVLELRVSTGKLRKRGEPIVVRGGRILAIGEWHRVIAGNYGARVFLRVDGILHSARMLPGETLPSSGTPLYLGGVPDLSDLPVGSVSGLPVPFKGCIRQLSLNWHRTALDREHILAARNIADCDGTGCGGDVCDHGGSCWLDKHHLPHCTCPQQYTGHRCETRVSCMEERCHNNGRCVRETSTTARCHCPLGWGGDFCEEAITLGSPHFRGNSYLVIEKPARVARHEDLTLQNDAFIGIGVDRGLLKLVWGWNGPTSNKILIPAGTVSDGEWHNLVLSFGVSNFTLWMDNALVHSKSVSKRIRSQPLITDGIFYLGER